MVKKNNCTIILGTHCILLYDYFLKIGKPFRREEMILHILRRAFISRQVKNNDINKNICFGENKYSKLWTQGLFTSSYHIKPRMREKAQQLHLQLLNKDTETIKKEVFERFESEGLRSVFNDEILAAISSSSTNDELDKCSALIGQI